MAEIQRVPAPPTPLDGRGEIAAMGLALLVIALIAKPWAADPQAAEATAPPTVHPTAESTPIPAGFAFDQDVFGPFKPTPEWSIWPGGIFVTILYVTREAEASEPPEVAGGETPAVTAIPDPYVPVGEASGWPATVTIGPGDHLLWLGLDTPSEFVVRDVAVSRLGPGRDRVEIPVRRLPSSWGPHFSIIGIPVTPESGRLAIWPMGSYDVEVTLDPDGSRRSIRIEIQTLDPIEGSAR